MNNAEKTVFVGLSGGVDSSVAAARLIDAGYNVVGVFIKVWQPEWLDCNWEQERLDAMRVAAHLGIPFLTCDAVDAYRDDVALYFIEEYKAGRTPNPDVMCNQHVKFGRFLQFAQEKGADYIATGHYAQKNLSDEAAIAELHRGVDNNKDQTYFLWTLSQEQLDFSLFPVGESPKDVIRQEAMERRIPVATKKDSQGICFLGQINIAEFLSHYVDLKPGNVLDTTGAVVGEHHGALVYTLGQRHGFTLHTADVTRTPHYVIEKHLDENELVVGESPPALPAGPDHALTLTTPVLRRRLLAGDKLTAQIRYRQTPFTVSVESIAPDAIILRPEKTTELPAQGQSCVLYDGTHCLGGGIIA